MVAKYNIKVLECMIFFSWLLTERILVWPNIHFSVCMLLQSTSCSFRKQIWIKIWLFVQSIWYPLLCVFYQVLVTYHYFPTVTHIWYLWSMYHCDGGIPLTWSLSVCSIKIFPAATAYNAAIPVNINNMFTVYLTQTHTL